MTKEIEPEIGIYQQTPKQIKDHVFRLVDELNDAISDAEKLGFIVDFNAKKYRDETIVVAELRMKPKE